MDSKQKKLILSSIYKAFAFFIVVSICWIVYYACNLLVKHEGILWLNIILIGLAFFLFLNLLISLVKFRKFKNTYKLSKYLFYISFLIISSIIAGIFALYYLKYELDMGYYLTAGVLCFADILSIIMAYVSVNLARIFKNTSVVIDYTSEIPTYDDELQLKKQLDELNRKLEIKKVAEQIEAIKKELNN